MPPALGAWSLTHWTTREVPLNLISAPRALWSEDTLQKAGCRVNIVCAPPNSHNLRECSRNAGEPAGGWCPISYKVTTDISSLTSWESEEQGPQISTANFSFLKFIYFFIFYFSLCWVFVALHRLSLVAASGGYSLLQCSGFSLWWLLLLRHTGFSSCGTQAQ